MTKNQAANRVLLAGAMALVGVLLAFAVAGLLNSAGFMLLGKAAFSIVVALPFFVDRAYVRRVERQSEDQARIARK